MIHSLFIRFLLIFRHIQRMTQGEAAMRCGISEHSWRSYELGTKPGESGLSKIATLTGVSSDRLRDMCQVPAPQDDVITSKMRTELISWVSGSEIAEHFGA